MTRAQDVMSSPALSCRLADSANHAARIMWEHDCGCVPIVDDEGRIVGIVTDRDICMGAYTQGRALFDVNVASVCTHQVHTCAMTDSLEHVEALMAKHQVRRLPVTDADGRLTGVLSLSDLVRRMRPTSATKKATEGSPLSPILEAVARWRHGPDHDESIKRHRTTHPDGGRHSKPTA